jgi:cytochrome c biogenesis factor
VRHARRKNRYGSEVRWPAYRRSASFFSSFRAQLVFLGLSRNPAFDFWILGLAPKWRYLGFPQPLSVFGAIASDWAVNCDEESGRIKWKWKRGAIAYE